MTEGSILDLATLLTPIEGDNPAGVDLRQDTSPSSVYYQLKDVRTTARNSERKALNEEGETEPNISDWMTIIKQAPGIIATQSKDLEVAAWLIEALARTSGFQGIKEGFELAKGLIDTFWEHLYPLIDEDGIETRLSPLIGLNGYGGDGTLIKPLTYIFITEGRDFGPFATWQYDQAFEIERIADPDKKQQRISSGAVSMEQLRGAAAQTSPLFFRKLKKEVDDALNTWQELTASIDTYTASEPQPTSNIKNALQRIQEAIIQIAGDALADPEEETTEEEESDNSEGAASSSNKPKGLSDRQAALKAIADAASYFRRTEPHSPISYLLEQAVRWSSMQLPDLMEELISDNSARDNLFRLAGIRNEGNE